MKNTSTVTKKGQITIPKEIRDDLNIFEKQQVTFHRDGNNIIVKPVTPISELAGTLKNKSKNKTTNLKEIRQKTKKEVAKNVVKEME